METLKFLMTSTFYPPYHIGGDAMHVFYLSNKLAEYGHDVHIIHSIDSYYWKRKLEPKKEYTNHNNVVVHSLKTHLKIQPIISYILGRSSSKIHNMINDIKPDILHHHNIAGFGPSIFDMKAIKSLYTAHDYWMICPMNGLMKYNGNICNFKTNCMMCSLSSMRPPQLWRYTNTFKNRIKNIDVIIAPSNYMKNKLLELGINNKFAVIPNFIPEFSEQQSSPIFNFSYFLFVGVIERHKGIINLINTFIKIKYETDTRLLIVGKGSLEDYVNNIIKKNNCDNKIVMLGRVDNYILPNIYKNALAVIIPSIWPENCPLVALEAISHGIPIIVSDKGGLPELVSNSSIGIVIKDIENSENLAKSIIEFRLKKNKNKSEENRGFNRFYRDYIKTLNL